VNAPNKEGYIAIMYAALHGNQQMIQFLEECGSNMQYRTTKNDNLLFMCAEHNRIKSLIYLMESKHQFQVNQTNIVGDTVLHVASRKGYTQMVSYLLTIGGDIEAANNDGETPLIAATK
jgi:ankyrin repeat protein